MHMLDTVGSFIVGGLVLLGILALFMTMSTSSTSHNMTYIQQMTATEFGRVLEFEMNKMGYRTTGTDKVLAFDSTSISFLADLNNDGTVDSVSYYRTGVRPYFQILRHSSLSTAKLFRQAATDFRLKGYTSSGAVTWERDQVRCIEVQMLLEKKVDRMDGEDKLGTYWVRRFFPKNLR